MQFRKQSFETCRYWQWCSQKFHFRSMRDEGEKNEARGEEQKEEARTVQLMRKQLGEETVPFVQG